MFIIINLGGLNMKKYIVALAKDERETLCALTSKGKHKSKKTKSSPGNEKDG
ncbi:hypothetical protein C5S53_06415 [Methanophagales archaeon]|nr:hypothetical protein C5S53_06415 [Methanophagales archaeon]